MARPSLFTNRKFIRLSRLLGGKYKAAGVLEMIWYHAYEDGDARLGSAEDIEYSVGWDGEPGELVTALLRCGCNGPGFIEEVADFPGQFMVHDLMDHAPSYVLQRAVKERERKIPKTCGQCGAEYRSASQTSVYCTDRCRVAAHRERHRSASDTDCNGTVTDSNVTVTVRNTTPAPAPAPAHRNKKHVFSPSEQRESNYALPGFGELWKLWPRGENKEGAGKAYKALSKADRDEALHGAPPYLAEKARTGESVPYLSTYLNQGRWRDLKTKKLDDGGAAESERKYQEAVKRQSGGGSGNLFAN